MIAAMRTIDPPNEAAFTTMVVQLARYCGWKVTHSRPAYERGRVRTALQGDAGAPDILMAKDGRVVLAELKMPKGRLSAEQEAWIAASGAYLWRPSDWPEICRVVGDGRVIE